MPDQTDTALTCHLDFETRSAADLMKGGHHLYASDPSTDALCAAWAFDDDPVDLWSPHQTADDITPLYEHVEQGGLLYAHNAAFEYIIWNKVMCSRYGAPRLFKSQLRCTAAMARYNGIPGDLERAAATLGLDQQKDKSGAALIRKLCAPADRLDDGRLLWNENPEDLQRMFAYCKQDVRTERALHKTLMGLPATEQKMFELDMSINDRGIHVDMALVRACIDLVALDKQDAEDCIRDLTDGQIRTPGQVGEMLDWLALHGLALRNMKADTVADAIGGDLRSEAREMLGLRQRYSKTSTAKLTPLVRSTGSDNRIRGTIMYYGAERTGRFAGRRLQPHNLPRPKIIKTPDMAEDVIPYVLAADLEKVEDYGPPMQVVSDLLRPCLTAAPGNVFLGADFAAIEARVLAWLGGQSDALAVFARGEDIYVHAARGCESDDRQFGKVQVLGLGFGMGAGTFIQTAAGYGIDMGDLFDFWLARATDAQVEKAKDTINLLGKGRFPWRQWLPAEMTKWTWRSNNSAIEAFWYGLEGAAHAAVRDPGSLHRAGPISYMMSGTTLLCRLPSGRLLCYPFANLALRETPWGEVKDTLRYRGLNDNNQQTWIYSYGGKLAENVTQAVARDLLRDALLRADTAGFDTVLHVHDEIVAEVPARETDKLADFVSTMEIVPDWAEGCPIKAEGWSGFRFRK